MSLNTSQFRNITLSDLDRSPPAEAHHDDMTDVRGTELLLEPGRLHGQPAEEVPWSSSSSAALGWARTAIFTRGHWTVLTEKSRD